MSNQARNLLNHNSLYKLGYSRDSIHTSSNNLNKLLPDETCSDFGFQKGKIYEIYGTIDSSRLSLVSDIICNCINKFNKDVLYLNSSYQIPQESLVDLLEDKSMIDKINTIKIIGNGTGMLHQIIKQELIENDRSKDYKLIVINDLPSLVYHETMNTDRRTIRNRKVLRTLNKNMKERRRYGCKFRLTKYERILKYGTKRFYNHTLNHLNIDQALQANKDQNLFHLFQSLKKYLAKNQDCCVIFTGVLGTKVIELFRTKAISISKFCDSNKELDHGRPDQEVLGASKRKKSEINKILNNQVRKQAENSPDVSEDNDTTDNDNDDDVFGSTFDDYELPDKQLTGEGINESQNFVGNQNTMVYNNVLIDTNKLIPTAIINKGLAKTYQKDENDFAINENFDEIDMELGNNYYDDYEIEMNNAESLDYSDLYSEANGFPEESEADKNEDTDLAINKIDNVPTMDDVENNSPSVAPDILHKMKSTLMETSNSKNTARMIPNTHTNNQQMIRSKMKLDELFENSLDRNKKDKDSKSEANIHKNKKTKMRKLEAPEKTHWKGSFQIVKSDDAQPIKRKQLVPLHGQNPLWYEFVDSRIILYKDWLVKPADNNISRTLCCRYPNSDSEQLRSQMPSKLISTDYAIVEKRSLKNYPLTNCDINLFMTEEQIRLNIVKKLCFFYSENGKIFDIELSKTKMTETILWKELEKKVEPRIKKSDLLNFQIDDFQDLLMNPKNKKSTKKMDAGSGSKDMRDYRSQIPESNFSNHDDSKSNTEEEKTERSSHIIPEYTSSFTEDPENKITKNKNHELNCSSQIYKANNIHENQCKPLKENDKNNKEAENVFSPVSIENIDNNKMISLSKKREIEKINADHIDDVEYNFLRSLKRTRTSTPSTYSFLDDLPSQTPDDSNTKISKFGRKLMDIYHDNRLPQFEDYENFDEDESENSADDVILESQVNAYTIEDSQQFDNDSDKLILPDAEYYKTIQRIRINLQNQVSNDKLIRVLNKIGKQSDSNLEK